MQSTIQQRKIPADAPQAYAHRRGEQAYPRELQVSDLQRGVPVGVAVQRPSKDTPARVRAVREVLLQEAEFQASYEAPPGHQAVPLHRVRQGVPHQAEARRAHQWPHRQRARQVQPLQRDLP